LAAVYHFVSVRLLRFVQNFGSVMYRTSEPLTYPEISHVDSIDATGYVGSKIEQVCQFSLNFEQTLIATYKAFDTLGNELSQIRALDPPTTAFMESATERLLSWVNSLDVGHHQSHESLPDKYVRRPPHGIPRDGIPHRHAKTQGILPKRRQVTDQPLVDEMPSTRELDMLFTTSPGTDRRVRGFGRAIQS
jgi:hypothetical protein